MIILWYDLLVWTEFVWFTLSGSPAYPIKISSLHHWYQSFQLANLFQIHPFSNLNKNTSMVYDNHSLLQMRQETASK